MIFPAGKPRNTDLNIASTPLMNQSEDIHNPRSRNYQPEFKKRASKERDRSWEQPSKGSKLTDTLYSALSKLSTISSARAGRLTDIGGAVRQMKTSTANSIWNPDRLKQIKDSELTQGERIKADNKTLQEKRASERKQNFHVDLDAFVEAYKDGVFEKGNSVRAQSAHAVQGNSRKTASHEFGIMESLDKLEELPVLTPGEQISANAKLRKAAKRDRSWEAPAAAQTSRNTLSQFLLNIKPANGGK